MFTSSSFEKDSPVAPENSSVGRSNISNRFPVGITALGDENQQIRIQLAVHKYNNASGNPVNNRRNLISPTKHSFLKNSPKARSYEGDVGQTSSNEKICTNRYDGVGTFPTVHLKKNAVLYRPIRRFNEVKVPNPELPMNRFLNNLPELCPDLKSNTRSVLDVLQDLSRKRIHSKEESECTKPRSRGLGGDTPVDAEAAYKPLFVKKPKSNLIATRDSTTQTIFSHNVDSVSSISTDSSAKSDVFDPRAELRRKLARQNNEIFASLSSSLSCFALKRKIDKISTSKGNDNENDVTVSKKSKTSENCVNNYEENSFSKPATGFKGKSTDQPTKINRKSRNIETNSISPNKDRLTTIFLDMQSTSPKTQVLQMNSISNETESSDQKNIPVSPANDNIQLKNNSILDKEAVNLVNGSTEKKDTPSSIETNSVTKSPSVNFASVQKKDQDEANKQALNFSAGLHTSNSLTNLNAATSPLFNFGSNNLSNFPKIPVADLTNGKMTLNEGSNPANKGFTVTNSVKNSASTDLSDGCKSTEKSTDISKENVANSVSSVENEPKKPDFSTFKFGAEASLATTPNQLTASKNLSSDLNINQARPQVNTLSSPIHTAVGTATTCTPTLMPQFSFGTNAAAVSSPSNSNLSINVGVSSSNGSVLSAFSNSAKPVYSFGQIATSSPNHQNPPTSTIKTDNTSSKTGFTLPASLTTTQSTTPAVSQNVQPSGLFTFDQKAKSDSSKSDPKPVFGIVKNDNQPQTSQAVVFGQSLSNQTTGFSQSGSSFQTVISTASNTFTSINNQTTTFGTSATTGDQCNKPTAVFSFGQKTNSSEVLKPSAAEPSSTSTEQKPQPNFTFTFGQKPTTQDTSQSKPEGSSFLQKSPANLFSLGQKPAAQESAQSAITSTTTFSQPNTTQATLFKQNLSLTQPTLGVPSLFGQNVSQPPSTSQNTNQVPTFGQITNPAAPTSNAFGTKPEGISFGQPSTASVFSQNNTSFSTQAPLFGTAATTQSITGFGASTQTQSTGFGVSTTSQISGFGAPPTTQSVTGFGTTATTQSSTGFGTLMTSQPTSGFGLASTPQTSSFTSAFGQTSNKPANALGQTSNVFGQPPSNQNLTPNTTFGAPSNTTFGAPDQNNIFGQKAPSNETNVFGQTAKVQQTPFGQNSTSQPFGTQNKFSFGMSTSTGTGFTSSPANTTAPSVFSFGGSTPAQGPAYSFGSTSSAGSSNSQTPFAFNSPNKDAFKFGASTAKEGSGFGSGASTTFNFGAQMNNNVTAEVKPPTSAFNFGSPQGGASSAPSFNFGSTPSPSVFSFGGSASSASSGSTFNFGAPQHSGPFGQPAGSPATPFAVPGTFSIGSGSSQSRPRASSRVRRRP